MGLPPSQHAELAERPLPKVQLVPMVQDALQKLGIIFSHVGAGQAC